MTVRTAILMAVMVVILSQSAAAAPVDISVTMRVGEETNLCCGRGNVFISVTADPPGIVDFEFREQALWAKCMVAGQTVVTVKHSIPGGQEVTFLVKIVCLAETEK